MRTNKKAQGDRQGGGGRFEIEARGRLETMLERHGLDDTFSIVNTSKKEFFSTCSRWPKSPYKPDAQIIFNCCGRVVVNVGIKKSCRERWAQDDRYAMIVENENIKWLEILEREHEEDGVEKTKRMVGHIVDVKCSLDWIVATRDPDGFRLEMERITAHLKKLAADHACTP
jgi:hypothetical protein